MSQYTEEEIDRIIDNCERITQDDVELIDEEDILPKIVDIRHIHNPKSELQNIVHFEELDDSEEYFDSFFQKTKEKKANKQVKFI